MSQTETLMLLGLGVFATLFLVLLFGRGLWSLLGRWSGWKEARKVPRAIRDLQAERDALKAEKAMMASKLESSLSDMKLRLAEQMAEVSRNRNRLLDANAKLQSQSSEIEDLKSEILKREEKTSALTAQIEENVKAISQAWAKTAEHESDTARAMTMHQEAVAAVDLRDVRIRALEAEARTLREGIAGFIPAKEPDMPLPLPLAEAASAEHSKLDVAIGNFRARFNINNPLSAPDRQMQPAAALAAEEDSELIPEATEDDPLDQGASNVLSLAERLRVLQKGIKK